MSSSVPRSERVRRGETRSLDDVPEHVSSIVSNIANEYGWCILRGSYWRGNWAEDSDVDVCAPVGRATVEEFVATFDSGTKMDANFLPGPSDSVLGLVVFRGGVS